MDRQESAVAIVLALGSMRDELKMTKVFVDVLWVAVKHRMSASDYTKVISGLCDGDYAVVEDDKIELTPRGVKFAEEIHEQLQRGNEHDQDESLDPQGAVGASWRGSEESRGHARRDDASDFAREVQGVPSYDLIQRAFIEALTDVCCSNGSKGVRTRVLHRIVRTHVDHALPGSVFGIHYTITGIKWMSEEGLIEIDNGRYSTLPRGDRAVSWAMSIRHTALLCD